MMQDIQCQGLDCYMSFATEADPKSLHVSGHFDCPESQPWTAGLSAAQYLGAKLMVE